MQWQLNTPNDLEGITEQKVDARTRAYIPLYSCICGWQCAETRKALHIGR